MTVANHDVRRTLELHFAPGDVVELRAFGVPAGRGYTKTHTGYFDDPEAFAAEAERLDAAGAEGVYFTINRVNPALLARASNRVKPAQKGESTNNADVVARRSLFIDADPKRPSGISSTEAEHDAAIARANVIRDKLTAAGWPTPILADSGNGAHLLYRIDLPNDDGGLVESCLKSLAERFGDNAVEIDTSVHNAARVCKVYGTTARKGDDMPHRPHRRSGILNAPEVLEVVPRELLEALAEEAPATRPRGVDAVGRLRDTTTDLQRIGSALAAVPSRPDYPDWLRLVAAVRAAVLEAGGSEVDAASLLVTWSPEERPGEYAAKFQNGLERVGAGTLFYMAREHGWADTSHPSPSGSASVGGLVWEWPEPEPITLTTERFPVRPFDPAWLPSGVRAWVADVAHRMQIALDFPAVAAMVMLSACIGRRVGIRPKQRDSWTVICNLWGAIVGRPGIMKSPVLKQIAAPLVRLNMEKQRSYADEMRDHDNAVLAFEARKAAVKEQMRRALKADVNADVNGLGAEIVPPEAPARTEYVVWDSSPEALIETARDNPAGFLHLRDELSGLLARLDAPTAGEERALYLSSWNGDESMVQKRIGRGYVAAEAVCQSMLGGIQPGKLTDILSAAIRGGIGDDGCAQRFQLMVQPDLPEAFDLVDEWPDNEARKVAYALVQMLVGLDASVLGATQDSDFEGQPEGVYYLRFDPAAQDAFNAWLTGLERRLRGGALHPAIESHLAKYRSLVPSLALILHLADGDSGAVSLTALERALEWVDYLEGHALRIYGMAQAPGEVGARQLARKVLGGETGTVFTVRDVYRKGWSGLSTQEDTRAAVDLLLDAGWLRESTTTNGRRTFTEYAVNPRLKDFTVSALLPRRGPLQTHRRMVTHEPAQPHKSAGVSPSVPHCVSENGRAKETEPWDTYPGLI